MCKTIICINGQDDRIETTPCNGVLLTYIGCRAQTKGKEREEYTSREEEGPLNAHDACQREKSHSTKLKGLRIAKGARSVFLRKYSPLELVELSLIELYKSLNEEKRKEQNVRDSLQH